MPTKTVRFATIKDKDDPENPEKFKAGHYPWPDIERGDTVRFYSATLNVTLFMSQDLRDKFDEVDIPSPLDISHGREGRTFTASEAIVLADQMDKNNFKVLDMKLANDGLELTCEDINAESHCDNKTEP